MKPVLAILALAALLLVSQEGVGAEKGVLKRGEAEQEERGQKLVFKADGGSSFKSRSDDASKEGTEEDAQGSEGKKITGASGGGKAGKKKGGSQEELGCEREKKGKTGGKKKKTKTKKGKGSKFRKDAKREKCRPRGDKLKQDAAKTMDAAAAAKKPREQHEKRTADGLRNAIEKRNEAMKSLDEIAPEIRLKKVDEGAVDLGEGDRLGEL